MFPSGNRIDSEYISPILDGVEAVGRGVLKIAVELTYTGDQA